MSHDTLERLALSPDVAVPMRVVAENTMRFVRPSHPGGIRTRLTVHADWLEKGRWVAMNPSIARLPDGYLVNYRLVNYRNRRASYYQLEPDGIIRSRNVLQRWTADGQVVAEYPLDLGDFAVAEGPYQGLEDVRLIVLDGRLDFSASYAQLRDLPIPRLVYGQTSLRVDALPPSGTPVRVTSLTELMASPIHQCEKNWMPVVWSGRLHWIYSMDPFTLLQWDGTNVVRARSDAPSSTLFLGSFRGSVGPVSPSEGLWLSLVHYYSTGDGRWYHHRWVQHDPETLAPKAVSATFCFNAVAGDAEVEFAAGLVVGHDGVLWVTYGKDDHEAWLARLDVTSVLAMPWYTC